MKHTFTMMLTVITVFVHAQINPLIEAQKCLGGSKTDMAESIRITKDGGYIIAGISSSDNGNVSGNHGGSDAWIVKLRRSGSIEWQKSLGGSNDDAAYSIVQTKDLGYIFAGYSYSNNGDVSGHHGEASYTDNWIVKLDSAGNIQWQKSLGGSVNDCARSIQQTKEGGYIIAGYSFSNDGDVSGHHGTVFYSDYWIVKLNSDGNIQWQKSLGGSLDEGASCIDQTKDSGYIVAGYSYSNNGDVSGHHQPIGYPDYWITKLDVNGNIQWQKSLGGSDLDAATSIQQIRDGSYIVAGSSSSIDGDVSSNHGYPYLDYWIVKLSADGNIQWQKSFGGSNEDQAISIDQTKDSGCVVAGYSYSNDGDVSGHHGEFDFQPDYWIVKIDANANIQWQESLGGLHSETPQAILQAFDGSYIIAGNTNSRDGDVIGLHGHLSYPDYWIVKLSPSGNFVSQLPVSTAAGANNSSGLQRPAISITISPNPVHSVLHITGLALNTTYELRVISESGIAVMQAAAKNVSFYDMDISKLSAGIYYLQAGNNTLKFVKE